ncbi:MAG TPA: TIGR02594 family protein [Pseudolabrys sp.]
MTATRRATILLCLVAAAVLATSAVARPAHHRHRVAQATAVASQMITGADRDMRYSANVERTAVQSAGEYVGRSRRHVRRSIGSAYARAQSHANSAYGGPTSNALVTEARKYIGTNPTGRASLWCGAFMDMVLKRTGHRGGGNLASAYSRYGTHVSGPQVGAIAVMGRRGGGHVGVVSGIDANGNPIIVSGNHNRTVAESVYPARRIHAYVLPGS